MMSSVIPLMHSVLANEPNQIKKNQNAILEGPIEVEWIYRVDRVSVHAENHPKRLQTQYS